MNENSKERIALKVLAAMEDEKLMNKEAAGIFDASPVYFSNLKHYAEKRDKPNYVPVGLWTALRAWYYSDKPLRGYKPPTPEELLEPVPAEASEAAKDQAQIPEPPAPEAPPLTKEEKKAQKAARIRELYERSKPPKKAPKQKEGKPADPAGQPAPEGQPEQPDTIIIPRGGDKVDLSKINLRTGTTIFTAEVTDNEIIIRFPLVRMERTTK